MEGWQIALIIILSIIVIGLIIFGFWWFFKKRKDKHENEKIKGGYVEFKFLKDFDKLLSKLTSDNVLMYSSVSDNKATSRYITWNFLENPNSSSQTLTLDDAIRKCLNYVFGNSNSKDSYKDASEHKNEFICGLSVAHFRAAFVNEN